MKNSSRFGRSRDFVSAIANFALITPLIAAAISRSSDRWKTLQLLGIMSLAFLAACGGGASQSVVNPPPPANPEIATILPASADVGGAAFTLTITGANFVAGSQATFGDTTPATTFVSASQLTAAIPASAIAATGVFSVTVINPAPRAGTSNSAPFTITTSGGGGAVPTLTLMFPSCVPAGEQFIDATDNLLTLSVTNIAPNAVVQWNGTNLPTSSQNIVDGLIAQVPASDIATAGTATVTVVNPGPGGGTSDPLTFTITPGADYPLSIALDPAGKFTYVASGGCNGGSSAYASMYTIDPATGVLATVAPPVPILDENTNSVAVNPSSTFAYVMSSGNYWDGDFGSVVAFSINPATGALTSTAGGVFGSGNPGTAGYFNSLTFAPSGKFAYATEGGADSGAFGGQNNVAVYAIDSTTGAMTSIGMADTETSPSSVALDPAGKFAYVTNNGSGNVSMYTIDPTTGSLTSSGTIAAGSSPDSVAVDPAGNFAYVSNYNSDDVSMFTMDATSGALTSIGTIAAGTGPVSVVVDPAGKFAYVANYASNDVSMYTIDATTGALTSNGTIAAGTNPTSIAIHPSGKFVYVTNSNSNNISIYSIDATTGALTLIGTMGT